MSVTRISYHGWRDCFLLANGSLEAVVVPSIGRIMQLRRTGETEGTFWENRALDGQLHNLPHNAVPDYWLNLGGDKCWPSPQSAWLKQQGRDWPPPVGFDALPMETALAANGLTLSSQIDPNFGIQVVRHVELDAKQPVMRIRTEYRKLSGNPLQTAVWTIAQMPHPERVCLLLAEQSKFAEGYINLRAAEPANLKIGGRLLSLDRHAQSQVKIGADGLSVAWVGRSSIVRMDAEAGPGEYPDGGCLTQIYTNPDPVPYVELETLGPLTLLTAGERIERTTVYTVLPRTTPDPEDDARKALS